jgi:hypothetical protein
LGCVLRFPDQFCGVFDVECRSEENCLVFDVIRWKSL